MYKNYNKFDFNVSIDSIYMIVRLLNEFLFNNYAEVKRNLILKNRYLITF